MRRTALYAFLVLGLMGLCASPVTAQVKDDPNAQFQEGVQLALNQAQTKALFA